MTQQKSKIKQSLKASSGMILARNVKIFFAFKKCVANLVS